MIDLRLLAADELSRVHEIDVSESGTFVYRYVAGRIEPVDETWRRVPRAEAWQRYVEDWRAVLAAGGAAVGAFAGEALAGIAIVRYRLEGDMAQLVGLFVSRDVRRQGVATRLVDEVARLARAHGARELYVSATPSESAVGFYTRQGFRLAERVNPELYALEPDDIHMIRAL